MTLSSETRRRNLDEALASFLEALGDKEFWALRISPSDYPDVLSATWTELTNRGWLEEMYMNFEMCQLMPPGYVRALKISGRSDDSQFREKLGRLCKVLKDFPKGRTDFALIPLQ